MVWFEFATLTQLFVDAPVDLGDVYLNVAVALSSIYIAQDRHLLNPIPFLWSGPIYRIATHLLITESIYWTTHKSCCFVGNYVNDTGNKTFVSQFSCIGLLDHWTRSAIIDRLK
jgi:hypothetical protein